MRSFINIVFKDSILSLSILFLIVFGIVILNSLDKTIFPVYYVYVFIALIFFFIFSLIDFDIVSLFSKHLYIGSVVLLLITLIIGRVTRGTVRWIHIGAGSFQPAEIVRPFLLLFFANYLGKGSLDLKKIIKSFVLLLLPVALIFAQPSLGVSILTIIGFVGILLASKFNKKYVFMGLVVCIALIPVAWSLLAPYQKQRITTFLDPGSDPRGAGYNSIQSTIAAGSGRIFGAGLGKGIQTQLAFLPEKETDFIFASISEELGLFGALLVLTATFLIFLRIVHFMENSVSPSARAYLSGFFLVYLTQVFIHVGMNMGMLPITGLPYPLVSAGGSSLLATMIGLGIALGAYRKD